VSKVSYSRIWRFGKLVIAKTTLTSMDQLESLISTPGVISVYAAKKLSHAPLYYLDPAEYSFRDRDIDNEFHKATGMWIGRNVTVAIIDTGIDYTHPDFWEADDKPVIRRLVSILYTWSNGSFVEWDLESNPNVEALLEFDESLWNKYGEPAFLDINGHGTHVAGIIAGRGRASNGAYKGIAPGAKLVVIKAFGRDGSSSIDLCLSALEWVYDNSAKYGIKILSLSWGASFASDGRDPLSLAVDRIVEDRNVWVFAAAGNEGNYPTTVVVPAVARRAIAVGAWDPYYDKLAPFSSLGPTIDLRMKPDVVAAGVFIVSTASQFVKFPSEYMVGEYYVALSGTSMATPVAAGIAADFIEYYRYWFGRDPSIDDFVKWVEANGRRINVVKDFITGVGIPLAPH